MPFGALMPTLFLYLLETEFVEIHEEYRDFLISNQLIYEHIFNGYVKDFIFQDQVSQSVYVQLEFSAEWFDVRLTWDPSNYSDISYIYVRRSQVWVPDFTIRNSEKTEESLPEETQYVYITYFGLVSTFWNLVVRQPCTLKLEKFPFDTQTCMFWIYSNSAGMDEIFVENRIVDKMDVKTWGNGEWNVVNVSVRDLIIYGGDTENEMQVGEYSIVIKRTTAYYVTIILIPCFLCTLIIVVGLFMAKPAELIGKLSVGLTGIMALVFLMGLAANSLPHTATVPDMTIYILTCLMQIVSSVLYVLLFPNDPFTKAIASLDFFKSEDKSQTRSRWRSVCRLITVHNLLCLCVITAAFVHLMILVNT
uniref:Neur_chan_LBD domain-containing protein n=1 Tax=Haemonchus contortus TaxID=6289 RepID=A0A7I5EBG4_HAECO